MDGQLAQLAAFVAHGNEWLAGDRSRPVSVAEGSTFQYVNEVRFTLTTGRIVKRTHSARDPAAWLHGLDARGVTSLWLDPRTTGSGLFPAHIAAALANGTRSAIVAKGHTAERWIATWNVGRPLAPDSRIWDVDYVGSAHRGGLRGLLDIPSARERLVGATSEARDLAYQLGWSEWARSFDEALAVGDSAAPRAPFHDDALPESSELPRRQLFGLASGAYVFGGMGSWNDMLPPDPSAEASYRRVTEELFAAVLQGVAAAVNPTQARR